MIIPLAQMMPGMQWIPVMLVLTAVGLFCGGISLVLLPFSRARNVRRGFGVWALIIGIVSPLFFLVVVGSDLITFAYLIVAAPALLGAIGVALSSKAVAEPRGFEVISKDNGDAKAGQS